MATAVRWERAQRTERVGDLERDGGSEVEFAEVLRHVAHALCSPLWAATSFLDSALTTRDNAPGDTFVQSLTHMKASHARLSEILAAIEELAAVAQQPMTLEPVDLSALARDVSADIIARGPAGQMNCWVADGLSVLGDRNLLGSALRHLMENAWEFRDRGRRAVVQIMNWSTAPDLFGSANADLCTICFRDNGIGFAPDLTSKLFCPFQKLHCDPALGGVGMGLSCVRRIVHRHGGRIWAEGIPGGGASFFMQLPAA